MPAASASDSTRPGCIHSVVDGHSGQVPNLRIENSTKPSFVAFRSRREYAPRKYLDKQNLGQPKSRLTSDPGACFCHFLMPALAVCCEELACVP